MSEECCDELSSNQQTTNDLLQQLLEMVGSGFKIVPINGATNPPDEAGGNCAPEFFDHDTDESDEEVLLQRDKALCITVERYVKAVLLGALTDMSATGLYADWVAGQFPQSVIAPLLKLTIVYPNVFSGLNAFFDALTGSEDLTEISCTMLNGLRGDMSNTFVNFRASLASESGSVGSLVSAANGLKSNFQLFNEALEMAYDEDLSEYECPCEEPTPDCSAPLELMIVESADTAGSTIESLGGDLYRFVQNTIAAGGKYITAIRDVSGRCLLVEPQGEDTQDPFAWNIQDCDGVWHDGISSFAPVETKEFAWQNTDPMNTIYKVTCVE